MTNPEAREILRERIVALSGVPDARVSHGPLDSTRRHQPWITLIPLADLAIGKAERIGATSYQARETDVLLTAYGQGAVDGLRAAASVLWTDSPDAVALPDAGVALRSVGDVQDQSAVVRTAHEPRAGCTIRIAYVASYEVTEPAEAAAIGVDLTEADGTTDSDAIHIEV